MRTENSIKSARFKTEGAFEGPITAVESFDLNGDDIDELWIGDADGVHGLFYESLIEYVTLDVEIQPQTRLMNDNLTIYMQQIKLQLL